MRRAMMALLLLLLPLLTGCWNLEEPEDLGVVAALGIDSLPRGGYRVTAEIAHPSGLSKAAGGTGGGGKSEPAYYITQEAPTVLQALKDASRQLARTVFWSETRVVLIGEPLARQGFTQALDLLARGEGTRRQVPVVVARPTAAAVLHLSPLGEDLIGNALVTQLRAAPHVGQYPHTSLNLALEEAGNEGIDPFLPLAASRGGHPTMIGSALFRGDRMVGTASWEESRGILWLQGKIEAGAVLSVPFSVRNRPPGRLGVSISRVAHRLSGDPGSGAPLAVRLQIASELTEANIPNLPLNGAMIQQTEKATAHAALVQIHSGLRAALRAHSDPVGFGRYLHRFHTASWHRLHRTWYQNLPGLTVAVEVSDTMLRSEMSAGTTNVRSRG